MREPLPLADELTAAYARLSGLLLSEETVQTALGLIASLARDTIAGASGAGVTLIDASGRKTTAAASDQTVAGADALQYELDEGPCLSAWAQRSVIRVDSLPDPRWPRWSAAVQGLELQSSLSAPMIVGSESLGAIKTYAARPHAFTARDEQTLAMFASQAAILVANMRSLESAKQLTEGLKDALRSRQVIGQAMGILMAGGGVDESAAFGKLVSLSQRQNRKLRDVAQDLVDSTINRRR